MWLLGFVSLLLGARAIQKYHEALLRNRSRRNCSRPRRSAPSVSADCEKKCLHLSLTGAALHLSSSFMVRILPRTSFGALLKLNSSFSPTSLLFQQGSLKPRCRTSYTTETVDCGTAEAQVRGTTVIAGSRCSLGSNARV